MKSESQQSTKKNIQKQKKALQKRKEPLMKQKENINNQLEPINDRLQMLNKQLESINGQVGKTIVILGSRAGIEDVAGVIQDFFYSLMSKLEQHGINPRDTNIDKIEKDVKIEVARQGTKKKNLVFSKVHNNMPLELIYRTEKDRKITKFKNEFLVMLKNLKANLNHIKVFNKDENIDVDSILKPFLSLNIQ